MMFEPFQAQNHTQSVGQYSPPMGGSLPLCINRSELRKWALSLAVQGGISSNARTLISAAREIVDYILSEPRDAE